MSNDTRRRYLRQQRDRLARKSSTVTTAASNGAEVVCEGSGLQFTADIPPMGFELVVDYEDQEGKRHQSRTTVDESAHLVPCPRCDSGGRVTNQQHGYDDRGVRYDYFASNEEEKQAVREALQLVDGREPLNLDVIITDFEQRGGVLATLAEWLRKQAKSVPAVLLQVVLGMVLNELLLGHGVTEEELDRLLEERRLEHHQELHIETPAEPGRRPEISKEEPRSEHGRPGQGRDLD